jgi:hypothetical protein
MSIRHVYYLLSMYHRPLRQTDGFFAFAFFQREVKVCLLLISYLLLLRRYVGNMGAIFPTVFVTM